jgi:hypothetical protein
MKEVNSSFRYPPDTRFIQTRSPESRTSAASMRGGGCSSSPTRLPLLLSWRLFLIVAGGARRYGQKNNFLHDRDSLHSNLLTERQEAGLPSMRGGGCSSSPTSSSIVEDFSNYLNSQSRPETRAEDRAVRPGRD